LLPATVDLFFLQTSKHKEKIDQNEHHKSRTRRRRRSFSKIRCTAAAALLEEAASPLRWGSKGTAAALEAVASITVVVCAGDGFGSHGAGNDHSDGCASSSGLLVLVHVLSRIIGSESGPSSMGPNSLLFAIFSRCPASAVGSSNPASTRRRDVSR
jgi:hypothetical protein